MKLIKMKFGFSTLVLLFFAFAEVGWGSEVTVPHKTITLSAPLSSLAKEAVSTEQDIQKILPSGWPTSGLHIFPEAGRQVWLDAIKSALKSIQMAAYKLSDPTIVEAIIKASKDKHVKVDILIQPETYKHEQSLNVASLINILKQNGINVYTLSSRFNQAHYKMILIDGKWGMVSSGNLDAESFDGVKEITVEPCRDFAITITNPKMIEEMALIFGADIMDKRISLPHSQLVWGPDTQRSVFLRMINAAQKSIRIYQQDFQDVGIAQAVAGAARAGVKVEVIMMPFPFSKTEDKNTPNQNFIRQAGGKVYLHNHHYIHAKLMIIDGDDTNNRLMYIGSCNFYPSSLDQTRELGILTSDSEQIKQVNAVFEKDLLKVASSQ